MKRDVRKWYIERVAMLTLVLAALCVPTGLAVAAAQDVAGQPAAVRLGAPSGAGVAAQPAPFRWDVSLAIAIAIGLPCLAAGYAVGKVGAAALGAASEKPELLTRSLLFVALAEGIAIYGLLVAILLLRYLT